MVLVDIPTQVKLIMITGNSVGTQNGTSLAVMVIWSDEIIPSYQDGEGNNNPEQYFNGYLFLYFVSNGAS